MFNLFKQVEERGISVAQLKEDNLKVKSHYNTTLTTLGVLLNNYAEYLNVKELEKLNEMLEGLEDVIHNIVGKEADNLVSQMMKRGVNVHELSFNLEKGNER